VLKIEGGESGWERKAPIYMLITGRCNDDWEVSNDEEGAYLVIMDEEDFGQ
jgi:hypothetical protein